MWTTVIEKAKIKSTDCSFRDINKTHVDNKKTRKTLAIDIEYLMT